MQTKAATQKCKNPDCNVTFEVRDNKIWCGTKCKNKSHRAAGKEELNANNRELAKLRKAAKMLRIIDSRMIENDMESVSVESLLLFDIPLNASSKIEEELVTENTIHWYGNYGISAIDDEGTRYKIHKR